MWQCGIAQLGPSLYIETVPTFCILNVGTVPTLCALYVRTVPTLYIWNVGTVLTLCICNVGTVPTLCSFRRHQSNLNPKKKERKRWGIPTFAGRLALPFLATASSSAFKKIKSKDVQNALKHEGRIDPCSDPEFELHNYIDYTRQSCFLALGS